MFLNERTNSSDFSPAELFICNCEERSELNELFKVERIAGMLEAEDI